MSSTYDTDRPTYNYEALRNPRYIRYLKVKEPSPTSQPHCSLYQVNFLYSFDYRALSYTWGASTPKRKLHITAHEGLHGGDEVEATVQVGQNLFDFLTACATQPWGRQMTRFMWIDQICIDQANPTERNDQVSIMNQIFKRATRVLVWLGCEPVMVEAARRLQDHGSDQGQALTTLLRHPYFSRVWIVQEVALGSNIRIVCGDVELTWDCMRDALSRLHVSQNHGIPPSAFAVIWDSQASHTLQQCLTRYCQNDCCDPRDRVYGLLGLTAERWRMPVDYTKTILQVYLDTVTALCEELFDISDPACFYPDSVKASSDPLTYRNTMLVLGRAMGLPENHLSGLVPFLHHLQDTYMSTRFRNIRYTCRILLPTTSYSSAASRRARPPARARRGWTPTVSSMQNVMATRRNPLMRDVIPTMGLQLAQTPIHSGDNRDNGPRLASDRWWFEHNGETHFYNCPPSNRNIAAVQPNHA